MKTYNCKNEELPVIGGYLSFSLKRDLADFTAFSPKFNNAYLTTFDGKIKAAMDLLNPKAETAELKIITARLYSSVDGLSRAANNLSTYIKMAGANVPLSAADFGIMLLRKKIRSKDVEGVLQGLHLVNTNILKYKDALMTQGLTEAFITELNTAMTSIAADNQAQYEIKENRKALVQSNIAVFKDLYTDITELCEVGKNLYRGKDAQKLSEYTFSNLLKNVRISHQTKEKKTDDDK
ncbi:MAG: hypothetical protein LBC98_02530 [Prevotellaceae bacterium]|jgi:hypothetical protein|nr:hypothetical protein [Prevotellaceae bacterium]